MVNYYLTQMTIAIVLHLFVFQGIMEIGDFKLIRDTAYDMGRINFFKYEEHNRSWNWV